MMQNVEKENNTLASLGVAITSGASTRTNFDSVYRLRPVHNVPGWNVQSAVTYTPRAKENASATIKSQVARILGANIHINPQGLEGKGARYLNAMPRSSPINP